MKEKFPIIVKYYQCKKIDKTLGQDQNGKIPYIFLPNIPANYGKIQSWTWYGEHGEASLEFFHECKPMEKEEAEKVKKQYQNAYNMHDDKYCIMIIKQRLNYSVMRNA